MTDRRYVSIVSGDMEKDYGTVESWLTDRKLYVSSSPVDDGEGKFAVTHYKTIKRANGYSLVELDLETGRKNQIRVHMSDLGHPVIGDRRYGSECDPLGRLALHAFKLCFYHPVTRELMEFETPYPTAFKGLMQKNKKLRLLKLNKRRLRFYFEQRLRIKVRQYPSVYILVGGWILLFWI